MSYPPDPNNPYGQQPGYGQPQQPAYGQQPGYGYPQQAAPAPGYGYPQQAAPGYGIPHQPVYGGHAGYVQQSYAGWGSRVAASLVDGLIIGVPVMILYIVGAAVGWEDAPSCTPTKLNSYCAGVSSTPTINGAGIAIMGLAYLLGLVAGIWLLYSEGKTGQTPGKKLVNIRVVREADGQPLGFGMAFVRRLAHFLDSLACGIGYLWPIWDAKKQTFADKVMNSVVVKS
ncbi:RDD family protein [Kitasatospora sp. NPDC054939]